MSASGTCSTPPGPGATAPSELMWVARDGERGAVRFDLARDFQYPALSPDGKTLAVSVRDATTQSGSGDPTARAEADRGGTANWRRLDRGGRSIVFSSNRRAARRTPSTFTKRRPTGARPARLLLHHTYGVWRGRSRRMGGGW